MSQQAGGFGRSSLPPLDDRRTSFRSLSGSDCDPLEQPLGKAVPATVPLSPDSRPKSAGSRSWGSSVLAAVRISCLMRTSRLSATSSQVIAIVMKSLPSSAARASSYGELLRITVDDSR